MPGRMPTPPTPPTGPSTSRVMLTATALTLGVGTVAAMGLMPDDTCHGCHASTELQIQRLHNQVAVFKIKRERLPDGLWELFDDEDDLPVDAWHRSFRLVSTLLDPGYDIQSAGPDGSFGTPDDITLSSL